MARIAFERSLYQDSQMRALLVLLLVELERCCVMEVAPIDPICEEILTLFRNNPNKNYTLRQLAELFFMNEKTLDRHFRRAYGSSISYCQRKIKLESVKRYLIEYPTVPLRLLAADFGFYDEFHLSKSFRAQYGVSPKHYRSENC
jgi:transcriptional regulator GlxA family with amidase domain